MKIKERERGERIKIQILFPISSYPFFTEQLSFSREERDGGSTGSSSLLREKEAKKGKKEGGKERKNERRDH